ncbi:hypothetical protein, partial [Caballeronia mineralivorans]|uniref:hypothetical protein n=1 Tax=Caballeronia mineralivorans TaxID=2010198 RepID=UPI0023F251EC
DLGLKRLSQKVRSETIQLYKCLNCQGEKSRRVRLCTLLRQPLKTEECAASLFKQAAASALRPHQVASLIGFQC